MKIVIIGAGLTGLSAAENLLKSKADVRIFEKSFAAGGLAHTVEVNGIRHDYTGHFLHLHDDAIRKKILKDILALSKKEENSILVHRKSFIYLKEKFIPFPFQAHMYYLPDNLKKECLREFLKTLNTVKKDKKKDFLDWMTNEYGSGITRYFMKPYNAKVWQMNSKELKEITTNVIRRFFPHPSPEEIIDGAVTDRIISTGYNADFYYPRTGIHELVGKYTEKVGNIELESKVEKVYWKKKKIIASGKEYDYDFLINTSPLKEFVLNILEPKNESLKKQAAKLRYSSVLNITVGWQGGAGPALRKKMTKGAHWIYFPEEKYDFYRVGFYPAISKKMAPRGCYSCYVEIAYREGGLPKQKDYKKIQQKVVKKLKRIEVIPEQAKIIQVPIQPIKPAYVLYDNNWESSRKKIFGFLENNDIYSGGRYGAWEYSSMDQAIKWGAKLAKKCLSKK
ncbi:MAG: FAD-dependent oxidoreductase [Elusimicrobiota bacterium]